MAGILDSIYQRSPVWVQTLGIAAYGVFWKQRRLGGVFQSQVDQFAARDRFSAEAWRQYQTARLRELFIHCFDQVPYYRRVWSQAGVSREELERFELEHLPRLPLTEKEAIRT